MVAGKLADKLIFTAIYIAVAIVVVWGARSITNYAQDAAFYRDFLIAWEASLLSMRHQNAAAPAYTDQEPIGYMEQLAAFMRGKGIKPPESNTKNAFIYRLRKFGEKPRQVLLLYKQNRIVLFGLPASTFDNLDAFIDGKRNPGQGRFTGQWGSDGISRIGTWEI